MEFLQPWMWGALALAIPIIAAFLNKRRVRERVVPSVVILRRMQTEEVSRSRMALPRHLLALVMYLLALAGVAFAASDPVWPGAEPRTTILVVDTSASMGAMEPERSSARLDRARRTIEDDVLPTLGWRDRVAVITAGPHHEVVVEPTVHRERVLHALRALEASGSSDGLKRAQDVAEAMCAHEDRADVLLVTDMAHDHLVGAQDESAQAHACAPRVLHIGGEAPNLGLTGFVAESVDAVGGVEVLVTVRNTSATAHTVIVDIEIDGLLSEIVSVAVPPKAAASRVVALEAPVGATLIKATLRADGDNALRADDVAYAALAPRPIAKVALITARPQGFLASALTLHDAAQVTTASPDGEMPPGAWDLVIFEGVASPALVDAVPDGAAIVSVGVDASFAQMERVADDPIKTPEVTWWDFDAPLFAYVDFDRVAIEQAHPIRATEGVRALASTGDGHALIAERTWEGHRVLALAFALERSDLVLRVAFANFVANLIDWSGALRSTDAPLAAAPKDLPVVHTGAKVSSLRGCMRNEAASVPVDEPLREAGCYRFVDGAGEVVGPPLVVNLLDAQETRIDPRVLPEDIEVLKPQQVRGEDAAAPPLAAQWLWRIGVLVALILLAIEGCFPGMVRRRARSAAASIRQRLEDGR